MWVNGEYRRSRAAHARNRGPVILAMRMRDSRDNPIDDAWVAGLFPELQATIARSYELQASRQAGAALKDDLPSAKLPTGTQSFLVGRYPAQL
jgi:hypothetical protein